MPISIAKIPDSCIRSFNEIMKVLLSHKTCKRKNIQKQLPSISWNFRSSLIISKAWELNQITLSVMIVPEKFTQGLGAFEKIYLCISKIFENWLQIVLMV